MQQTKTVEENAHFIFNNVFLKSYHLGDNFAKYVVARQVTRIRRIRFACWITKAKDTHSEYVLITAFLCKQ